MAGFVFCIAPTLGWTWPSLLPIAMLIGAKHGYEALTRADGKGLLRGKLTKEMEQLRKISVPIDDLIENLIGDEVARDERMIFKREDRTLIFRRDMRGKFFIDVLGPKNVSAYKLRKEALDFAQNLVQEFAYNRVVQEMEARGINVVEESVEEVSGDVILEIRKWQ